MNNSELAALEKELTHYDFASLEKEVATTKQQIANAKTKEEVTSALCNIWQKIRKYVLALSVIPVIGKFVKLFAELMDSLCPSK